MSYQKIDAFLDEWAQAHELTVYKIYKDCEVRSVEDRSGKPFLFQIWIDQPDHNDLVGVHVWDLQKNGRREDFLVSLDDLRMRLERTLEIAKSWALNK